ncbi:acyl-CoA N-acyltransferase [Truncatella angustata]|uniref:Acyl-CoA N-acyltransferase n=1 Tax=Truncatella angustata TaxID=152316 RepID=A0A9P8U8I3_9PEZI|nr:acyl-CoA N-acyltransferase [Truncatella angustata]KAH6645229.1 acyl-CoA N-acyltransferase [Truncatella angustata]KAH8200226.1 hypothetical protein TruAng_005618 [Truncatella angustata]
MASTRLNFRPATEEDAIPLEHLINTAFRDDKTTQVFLSTDHVGIDVTNVDGIKAKISQPNCAVFVGVDPEGTIVAHGSVRKLDETRAWFGLLAVDVLYQKRGLGSQVLAYAEYYARKEWTSTRMEFDAVNTRSELIAWYKHRGYKETGETTPFPYEYHGDWRGVLRDDLHFVVFGKNLGEDDLAMRPAT